jgi:hypothetical protein
MPKLSASQGEIALRAFQSLDSEKMLNLRGEPWEQGRQQRSCGDGRSALNYRVARGGGVVKGDGNDGVIRMRDQNPHASLREPWGTQRLAHPSRQMRCTRSFTTRRAPPVPIGDFRFEISKGGNG